MTGSCYAVRSPRVEEADEVGRVHVTVWREAYAETMPAHFLEGLDPVRAADRWRLRLEMDEPDGIVVVATGREAEIVGMASAGPTRDADAPTDWELYSINVLAAHHGSGVADQLIAAAVAERPATLWVLRDNPRAEAFYRRHGFSVEGATKIHEGSGAREIRMIRRAVPPDLESERHQPAQRRR
jgi:ribosomal protein S18 acetylase RimI-like enzyme